MQVDLEPNLPDGTYVVSYGLVSADGHPVSGGSVFGVGDVAVASGSLGRVEAGGGDRRWTQRLPLRGRRPTVIVQGYGGEPYLRFNPDGTIERTTLSGSEGERAACPLQQAKVRLAVPERQAISTAAGRTNSSEEDGEAGRRRNARASPRA